MLYNYNTIFENYLVIYKYTSIPKLNAEKSAYKLYGTFLHIADSLYFICYFIFYLVCELHHGRSYWNHFLNENNLKPTFMQYYNTVYNVGYIYN